MTDQLLINLNKKQYDLLLKSEYYKQELTEMCGRIEKEAKTAPNEATIEGFFECELFTFFRNNIEPLGFRYNPIKEKSIATRRHITKGRADTVIGSLTIEFKQPLTLANENDQEKAIRQISDYIEGSCMDGDLPAIGFITDGLNGCFITMAEGVLHKEPFSELTYETLDRMIQNIVSLSFTALNSKNLVNSFCNPPDNDGVAFRLFRSLYRTLDNMADKTKMLFIEWKELFNLAHDDISKQQAIIDRRTSLGELAGEEFTKNEQEYKALFALQTTYAIIVKIIAYKVVSQARYKRSLVDFESLKGLTPDALRTQLAALEDGAIFREYGVTNLLEGDFFSWYCNKEQWTRDVAMKIIDVLSVLSSYSDKPVLNKVERSQDFFKALYESMMPSAVRHSLGEYYTKKWLARQTVEDAIGLSATTEWRGLDPCCGSGTFITVMIDKILQQLNGCDDKVVLDSILKRVKGIDLNPIAVLTARVNYFINISFLLHDNDDIEIPIYLGDSSYVPQKVKYNDINCFEYSINTLQKPINIIVPKSMVSDSLAFSKAMTQIELHIKNLDAKGVFDMLLLLVDSSDATTAIKEKLFELANELIELERRNWDGIWARIITNFLTTANLGKFDIIVGNPPWVDWKNLPSRYRDRIKSFCISRKLFSGDKLVGGINLNICALIANITAENWLNEERGILAFLMPEPLVFQQSYEGFRNLILSDDRRLYFCRFTNWTKSGHPFKPVTQKFLTYFITHEKQDYSKGIDVDWYILKKGKNIDGKEELDIREYFTKKSTILATCHSDRNLFSHIENESQLDVFKVISGKCNYIGREGVEFYPQELMIFTQSDLSGTETCVALKNIQVKKSKHRVPQQNVLLESEFLHPLIKGVDVEPFHVKISGYIVPFPYDKSNPKYPIPITDLTKRAPKLAGFYQKNKEVILEKTGYNERIIGNKNEFYALARVGAYSYAENYVVFRDNTKWGAAVISSIETPWGGKKRPLFQNHAVSICEDTDGNFITFDEAHYVCGILNSPIATRYILQSSDLRSFPIRPRIAIPKYEPTNERHNRIAALSKEAHLYFDNKETIEQILHEIDKVYLTIQE